MEKIFYPALGHLLQLGKSLLSFLRHCVSKLPKKNLQKIITGQSSNLYLRLCTIVLCVCWIPNKRKLKKRQGIFILVFLKTNNYRAFTTSSSAPKMKKNSATSMTYYSKKYFLNVCDKWGAFPQIAPFCWF